MAIEIKTTAKIEKSLNLDTFIINTPKLLTNKKEYKIYLYFARVKTKKYE